MPAPSAIIGSGGGLHAYWISSNPLTVDEWKPYAEGLKAAAIGLGLLCDAGLTTDCARILRIPGTFNYKTDPPKRVETLYLAPEDYDFSVALADLAAVGTTFTATVNPKPTPAFDLSAFAGKRPAAAFAALNPDGDHLSDGLGYSDTPLDPRPVIQGCAFFKDAFKTHGKEHSQPLWNLAILATTFFEKGDVLAHEIGNHHPGYTPESTDAMYARKLKERTQKGLGWPSCKTIEGEGCKLCNGCQHYGQIKSPLHLAHSPHASSVISSPLAPAPSASQVWPATGQVSFVGLPHRRWLYGTYLIRGEVTILASPGGAGKTALATGIAVEIATGMTVLDEQIYGGPELKVLVINGEDSTNEIARRIWAFCLAHANKIAVQSPDRLSVFGANDPQVQGLSFFTTDKTISILNRTAIVSFEAALETLRPDLVILDPLIAFCGGGNMNDNALMASLVRELKGLAGKFDCAVMIVHHTRKGADGGDAEAVSGAAAIVNLARRAIMPVPMSKDEARQLSVLPSEQPRYFKLVDAKSNFALRSASSPWYRLHSVELFNAEPPIYPFGDNVQAIARIDLPSANSIVATEDQKMRVAILDLVDRGKVIDGKAYPYSPDDKGARNERSLVDDAVAVALEATATRQWSPGDLEAVVKGIIKKMKSDGSLLVKDVKELVSDPGRFRKARGLTTASARPQLHNTSKPSSTK